MNIQLKCRKRKDEERVTMIQHNFLVKTARVPSVRLLLCTPQNIRERPNTLDTFWMENIWQMGSN